MTNTEMNTEMLVKTSQRVAIVGAGQAAAWAAHTLRSEGFAGEIAVLGDELHLPYERPFLSKGLLLGRQNPGDGNIFAGNHWREISVECRLGAKVTALNLDSRTLVVDNGSKLDWDMLLLCTGGRARLIGLPDVSTRVHTIRTIDDAVSLRKKLESAKSAVVIGGGWIGLEAASAASQSGVDVTVLEQGGRLCERALPAEASLWLKSLHESEGVKIECGVTLQGVVDVAGGSVAVQTSDGREWLADVVIAGVGMIPNDELARAAGLMCDGGIVVDEKCRTSHPLVFAAGDVASTYNSAFGRHMRMESWQNAQDQGAAAAKAMLGRAVKYDLLPWFWSDQHARNVQIVGVPAAGERVELSYPAGAGEESLLWSYFKGEELVGAVGVDAPRAIRALRKRMSAQRSAGL